MADLDFWLRVPRNTCAGDGRAAARRERGSTGSGTLQEGRDGRRHWDAAATACERAVWPRGHAAHLSEAALSQPPAGGIDRRVGHLNLQGEEGGGVRRAAGGGGQRRHDAARQLGGSAATEQSSARTRGELITTAPALPSSPATTRMARAGCHGGAAKGSRLPPAAAPPRRRRALDGAHRRGAAPPALVLPWAGAPVPLPYRPA